MNVVGVSPTAVADPRRQQHEEAELRALVARAQDDADAFAALYRRYLPVVYGFAFRRSSSREVAEDVTSATFERVWRALPAFEWRGGGFEPWLFRIAAVEVAAHYRRAQRADQPRAQAALRDLALVAAGTPSIGGDFTGTDHGGDTETGDDTDRLERVRQALAGLRPRYQEAISLRYFAGISHAEAAEAMGCSKAVMAVTLHRATAALRRALQVGKEGSP